MDTWLYFKIFLIFSLEIKVVIISPTCVIWCPFHRSKVSTLSWKSNNGNSHLTHKYIIIAVKHWSRQITKSLKGWITEIEIVMVFPNICQWMHFTCQRLFTTPITFHSLMEKVAIIFRSITYLDLYFKRQYHPQLDISKDEKEAQHDNFSEFCISSRFGHYACHLLRIFRIQIWLTGST